MAFNGLSDSQLQTLIIKDINPDTHLVVVMEQMPGWWLLNSSETPQLQFWLTKRDAIFCLMGEVRKHIEMSIGEDRFNDAQKLSNLKVLYDVVMDEIKRLRGGMKSLAPLVSGSSSNPIPDAYQDYIQSLPSGLETGSNREF